MTMNVVRLFTYWDVDQAQTVIDFLDQLRDTLIDHYGEPIAQQRRAEQQLAKQQVDFIDDGLFDDDPF